jgi:small-conductance mechanosensitive channel
MSDPSLYPLPSWIYQVLWSLIAVLTVYLLGRFLARTVCRRLREWASHTAWQWDDAAVDTLQRGIPLWSLLFGLYLVTGFWPMSPHVLEAVTRSLYVLTWLSVTVLAASLAGRLVILYGRKISQAMPVTSLTENIVKLAITGLGLLMILHGLGISIAPLLTALGVGGLAVALALQDTLSNLFSGFYLSMERQIRVGDYVKLESGQEGYVEDISWRATKIRMLPNNMVLVPNNKLAQAIITNYYLPSRDLAVLVEVGVDYASDLARVERVTIEVARDVMRTVAGGVPEFDPFLRYHTLGDFSIGFTVILRAKEFTDQYLLKHEFLKRLIVRYRQEGIVIPFPTRTVLTKDLD